MFLPGAVPNKRKIRELRLQGLSYQAIADQLEISLSAAWRIDKNIKSHVYKFARNKKLYSLRQKGTSYRQLAKMFNLDVRMAWETVKREEGRFIIDGRLYHTHPFISDTLARGIRFTKYTC